MPEDQTTFVERTKSLAKRNPKKTAGAVSVATLAVAFQLFVTQSVFTDYRQSQKEDIARNWRALQDLDQKVDSARMDLIRLQERAILTSTNR